MRKTTAVALSLWLLAALTARSASAQGPSAEEDAEPKTTAGPMVHGVVLGGASTSSLFGVGSAAGHASVGIVVGRAGLVRASFFADGDIGSTFGGLPMKDVTLSLPVLFVLGSVRLGLGPELTYMTLSRAPTSTLAPIAGLGIGLTGLVSVDLLRSEQDDALFVALRPQVSWLHDAETPLTLTHYGNLVTGALLLGVRF